MRLPRGLVLTLSSSALAIALSLVHFFEGVRYVAYQDVGGVWTICNGHTSHVLPGQVATKAQCQAMEAADTAEAADQVRRLITVPMPPARLAALTDFVVNLGPVTLAKSSVRRDLNAGNTAAGCAAIDLYRDVDGHDCRLARSDCPGIVTRRHVERWLCEMPQ